MYIIILGGVVVLLGVVHDASGTAQLVVSTLKVGGLTWVTKKITEQINRDASQLIQFAGYSIAGVSAVKILQNAIGSVNDASMFFVKIGSAINGFANLLDKLTFWN